MSSYRGPLEQSMPRISLDSKDASSDLNASEVASSFSSFFAFSCSGSSFGTSILLFEFDRSTEFLEQCEKYQAYISEIDSVTV